MNNGPFLTHEDVSGQDLLAPEFLDAKILWIAVPPVDAAAAAFFMCHTSVPLLMMPKTFSLRLYADRGDFDLRIHLPVARFAFIAFPSFLFHDHDFPVFRVVQDRGLDHRAFDEPSAYADLFAVTD